MLPAFKHILMIFLATPNKIERNRIQSQKHQFNGRSDNERQGLHTTGYSVMSQQKLASIYKSSDKNLVIPKSNLSFLIPSSVRNANIISPNQSRPVSAMESSFSNNVAAEEIREKYWGKYVARVE